MAFSLVLVGPLYFAVNWEPEHVKLSRGPRLIELRRRPGRVAFSLMTRDEQN